MQLDRLVDGELSEADRRTMLLNLEREPEGWRRCALAFLEAQCWTQELGLMARSPERMEREPEKAVSPVCLASRIGRPAAWRRHVATALTMGACFLIALALGVGIRGNLSGGLHDHDSAAVRTVKDEDSPSGSATQADKWELVTLSTDSPNGQTETVSIPAVHRDAIDQNMLEQVPDGIPPAVRQALVQAGHQIEEHREVVPVQMDDGHRLMVPVNNVQIHYVGRGSL
jgi:hypothetical protein